MAFWARFLHFLWWQRQFNQQRWPKDEICLWKNISRKEKCKIWQTIFIELREANSKFLRKFQRAEEKGFDFLSQTKMEIKLEKKISDSPNVFANTQQLFWYRPFWNGDPWIRLELKKNQRYSFRVGILKCQDLRASLSHRRFPNSSRGFLSKQMEYPSSRSLRKI